MEARVRDLESRVDVHEQRIFAAEKREENFYERDFKSMRDAFDKMSDKIAKQEARMAYIIGAAAGLSAVIGGTTGSIVAAVFGG